VHSAAVVILSEWQFHISDCVFQKTIILKAIHTAAFYNEATMNASDQDTNANLNYLAGLPVSESTARAIEKIAIHAQDPDIRERAFRLLAAEPYAQVVRLFRSVPSGGRQFFINEIRQLEAEGLIPADLARVIINRYETAPTESSVGRVGSAAEAKEKRKQPSLAQILLSDTTLKVALFLGAFFVVVAAFILAALVEVTRVPILLLLTGSFFAGAFYLKPRIPLASFILYMAASALIPIVARAIVLPADSDTGILRYYWPAVWTITAAALAYGSRRYLSRLLVLATFLTGGYCAGLWIWTGFEDVHILLFGLGVWALAGLAVSEKLKHWGENKNLDQFLFWETQIWQVFVFGTSFITLLSQTFENRRSLPSGAEWLWVSALWVLGAAFYLLSDRCTRQRGRRFWWQIPFTITILPIPTLLASIWLTGSQSHFLIIWIWGAVLAFIAEAVTRFLPEEKLYALFLRIPLPLVFLLAVFGEMIDDNPIQAIRYLAGAGIVFGLLAYRRSRWIFSILALFFLYLAYIWQFGIWADEFNTAIFEANIFFFFPALLLLTIHLILRKMNQGFAWQIGSLTVGAFAAVIHLGLLMGDTGKDYGQVVGVLLGYGIYSLAYAIVDRRPWLVYLSATYLLLGVLRWVTEVSDDNTALLLSVLALIYYLVGILLEDWRDDAVRYGKVWRYSGLGYGVLITLIALAQATPTATIAPALAASAFAIEAFRKKNIWLGYPTNALYFCAYIIGLGNLEVSEPQFYSIGAALLGIIMHYLVTRSAEGNRHKLAAFVTGTLAQLVLLSTTYVQMQMQHDFTFFFMLFFQALALLIYGLTVRSKSFVLLPILFLVLSALTVAFTILSGLSTALIIGVTGLALLLIGVIGLGFRSKIAVVTEQFNVKLNNW
jgi:hypothetical protein